MKNTLIRFSTFVASVLFGAFDFGGKLKWIWPVFFGFMYMLLEYVTYRLGNTIAFGNINPLDKNDGKLLLVGEKSNISLSKKGEIREAINDA